MKQIEGGVTAAKGYTTAGTRAGIKKGKTNKDMAMCLHWDSIFPLAFPLPFYLV